MISEKIKHSAYDYLFCALIIALPYSIKFPNILMILLSIFFIADYRKLRDLNWNRLNTPIFYTLYSLVVYWMLKGLITQSISETKYGLLLPVLLLPVLSLKIKNPTKVLVSIVGTGFLIAATALFGVIRYYMLNGQLLPFEGNVVNEILRMERPYLGFFSVVSILISLKLSLSFRKYRVILWLYSLFVAVVILLISARISALTLCFLIFLYLFFYLKTARKYKILILISSVVFLSGMLTFNKTLRDRFFILDSFDKSMAKFKLYEPRVIIWPCAYEVINLAEFDPVFGLDSEKELNRYMTSCYDREITNRDRAGFFISSELNTHNQFIGSFLTSGVIGLGLLLLLILIQLVKWHKDFIKTALLFTLLLFLIVENVFYRQMGIYFFMLVILIMNVFRMEEQQRPIDDIPESID